MLSSSRLRLLLSYLSTHRTAVIVIHPQGLRVSRGHAETCLGKHGFRVNGTPCPEEADLMSLLTSESVLKLVTEAVTLVTYTPPDYSIAPLGPLSAFEEGGVSPQACFARRVGKLLTIVLDSDHVLELVAICGASYMVVHEQEAAERFYQEGMLLLLRNSAEELAEFFPPKYSLSGSSSVLD